MSEPGDVTAWLARRAHPRLALTVLLGAGLAVIGVGLFLTAGPLGHGLGRPGLGIGILGALAFAYGASGYLAFAVFERSFD